MNYCNNCGDPIEPNEKYCNKCGNLLKKNANIVNPQSVINTRDFNEQLNVKDGRKKGILLGIGIGVGVVMFLFIVALLVEKQNNKYYFDANSHDNSEEIVQNQGTSSSVRGKYSTAIIYDNTYSGVSIKGSEDAYNLIEKDSITQKSNCPSEIKNIEDDIIKKYGITAVNLCEMDINFASEIGNVIKKIYDEYPSARGYITNLTLANVSMSEGYIAAFMPIFNFATSDSSSTYPWVIKTQVLLNTSYFLNIERLQATVMDGSNVGHFPPNATIYSPVAHELGHYLSFLAMMENYKLNSILLVGSKNVNTFYEVLSDFGEGEFSLQMIKEAYENYKKDTGTTITLDEWRGTISKYALAKDNKGEYIWDETIAESFHDVYLNGESAKDASKYIVSVLKSKLES